MISTKEPSLRYRFRQVCLRSTSSIFLCHLLRSGRRSFAQGELLFHQSNIHVSVFDWAVVSPIFVGTRSPSISIWSLQTDALCEASGLPSVSTALCPRWSLTLSPGSRLALVLWELFHRLECFRWLRSMRDAKWNSLSSVFAGCTSDCGSNFFTSEARRPFTLSHFSSTAALPSGLFMASFTAVGRCTVFFFVRWSMCFVVLLGPTFFC